jgi:hypothetical protein
MAASANDLADALIRMFGCHAAHQARENAASNARAGDAASEKMWLGVADLVGVKLSALRQVGPR